MSSAIILQAFAVLLAAVYCSMLSSLYKRTPMFAFINNLMLGVALGNTILVNYNVLANVTMPRIMQGQPIFIFVFVFGAMFWTALVPTLRPIYRFVSILTLGQGLGLMLYISMQKVWNWTAQFAVSGLTGPIGFIALVFFAAGVSTMLFHKNFESGKMRIPMEIGRWGLLLYAAYFIGTYQSGIAASIMFYVISILTGVAWWVPYLMLGYIFLDAIGVFRKLRGQKPKVETTAQ
jgi:hypothetical protein